MANCGRTGPATRCIFRRARAAAGLYEAEETARWLSQSDAEKALHLRSEAARRGLRLTDEVVWYLLNHLPRDLASLHAVLDRLDRHSLARQRPVTLPLVREVLSSNSDG